MLLWLSFFACTAVIVFAGTNLSRYADIIAEQTGLGRTFIGVVLMASVTSLPELITGITSVTVYDLPNIAAGDVLGSCMFNILILALLDAMSGVTPLSTRAHQGQILSGAFGILLMGLAGLGIAAKDGFPAIGWIGSYSVMLLLVYLLAMRIVFLYEKSRIAQMAHELTAVLHPEGTARRNAYIMYGLNAILVAGAATWLPSIGERLAAATGLGGTFVGSVLIALSTSLPEVVVSVAGIRTGAVDLVIGNLFGSNLFNIGVLAIDDILYTRGPLLSYITGNHVVTVCSAMTMTAIAVIGLIYRSGRKVMLFAWDSAGILLVYSLALLLLLETR